MMTCEMCGKESPLMTNRWYKYDNGEQFRAIVCLACARLHDRLTDKNVRSV